MLVHPACSRLIDAVAEDNSRDNLEKHSTTKDTKSKKKKAKTSQGCRERFPAIFFVSFVPFVVNSF